MIYFMLPDEAAPTGGIRFSYSLVDSLNSCGFDSAVWHGFGDFRCEWFANRTTVVNAAKLRLNVGDILVASEWGGPAFAGLTMPAAVVMLVQNHFNIFKGVDAFEELSGPYPGWPNVISALVVSKAGRDFVERSLVSALPVFHVPCFVDSELFRPTTKEKIIAFMPRRRHDDLAAVIQLLRRRPKLSGWRFEAIEGMSERQTADVLARAAIFLSGSDREGFGLPPAEAMAAGCHVVGFTGDGGREFMLPEFCTVVEDQDLVSFAAAVETIVDSLEQDRSALDVRTTGGRAFVCEAYSSEATRERLEEAFQILIRPGSPARQPEQVEVRHFPVRKTSRHPEFVRWTPPALGTAFRNSRSWFRGRRPLG